MKKHNKFKVAVHAVQNIHMMQRSPRKRKKNRQLHQCLCVYRVCGDFFHILGKLCLHKRQRHLVPTNKGFTMITLSKH